MFTLICILTKLVDWVSLDVITGDGLQNETMILPTETKVKLIQKLARAGCSHIETASFVSPKKVPAMADSNEVMMKLKNWKMSEAGKNCWFSALTPNLRGFDDAMNIGPGVIDEVAIFASASETFSQKNIGCSIDESFERFRLVAKKANNLKIPVRGYVSCVLGCPYEGDIKGSKVAKVSEELMNMGCNEISLGDTIGVGTPIATRSMLNDVKAAISVDQLAVHFHDTYGQALANIFVSLEENVRTIDTSIAGLGGCPYAAGASGNVATEDVVYMLNGMGIRTGVDLYLLADAARYILDALGKESNSKCGKAFLAKNVST